MKTLVLAAVFALLTEGVAVEPKEDPALRSLTNKIGTTFWSAPEKRLVRATTYQKGKNAGDPNSAKGKSDEKCGLCYATPKEAGTLAVPQWLPRGSMVKIHTVQGVLSYIAADEGSGVESRKAAAAAGKTEEEKAAPVLDFCAAKQLWPDFVIVEIYYYSGKVAFPDLSPAEQKALFGYAMEYVTKRE
jgi:hypothetical protein